MLQRWFRRVAVIALVALGGLAVSSAPASAHDKPSCPAGSTGYERPADLKHGTSGKGPHFEYTQKGRVITWGGPRGYKVTLVYVYDQTYKTGEGPGKKEGTISMRPPVDEPWKAMGYSWTVPEDFTLMEFCVAPAQTWDVPSGKGPLYAFIVFLGIVVWLSIKARQRGH